MNSKIKTSVVLFGILEESSKNYRKLSKKSLGVLLVKDELGYSFPEYECETLIDLEAQSNLAIDNCTGLKDVYVEQLYTFSKVINDMLLINPTFLGLISKEKMYKGLMKNCYWCQLKIDEEKDGYLCEVINERETFTFSVSKQLKMHTTDRYKFYEVNNGLLKNGVSKILISAFERLRNKIYYTDIVFNMMGDKFTLKELQNVYEVINNKKLIDAAFRRVIINKVEETKDVLKGIGCRPSKLYKYKEKNV